MVAVPEVRIGAPVALVAADRPVVPVVRRRVVAVAVSPMELLRPASDLARLVESFDHVDLLVATEDVCPAGPGPVGVLGTTCSDAAGTGPDERRGPQRDDEYSGTFDDRYDDLDDEPDEPDGDEVVSRVAELGLPGLHLHRLGLRRPCGPAAERDLVAAMSELVGFDPEPGVYCLAPAPLPGDSARAAVSSAAQRIAQVYGLPLLRYRCLELSVVPENAAP